MQILLLWVRVLGGGWEGVCRWGDVRKGSQTVRLISPFVFWPTHSERSFGKRHKLFKNPTWWTGAETSEVVTWRIASQLQCHNTSPPPPQNKMSAKSTLHCTDDRMHQSFSLALNPLGYVEEAAGFCAALEWQSFRNSSIQPTEKKHFSITACPLVSDSPLCGSHEPPPTPKPYILCLRSEHTGGKRGWKRGLPRTSYGC